MVKALFTICAGLGPGQLSSLYGSVDLRRAAANWDSLAIEQVLVGEWDLPPHPGRYIKAEVATTAGDNPTLGELLHSAAEQASHAWLLLLEADALLAPELIHDLNQLCSNPNLRRLALGRSWRLRREQLAATPDAEQLSACIERHGCCDGPQYPGWLLVPRGCLLSPPATLDCSLQQAVPWLCGAAAQLGWPLLEATAVAPLARPEPEQASAPAHHALPTPTAVVLPHRPGQPLLSLLLAAPQQQLQQLRDALLPTTTLPWEVIARPAEAGDGPGAVAAAWTSALEQAQAPIAWPLVEAPPLALLPVVLRCFESAGTDLLLLAWSLAGLTMPAGEAWQQQPGSLVLQTAWLRRIGGFAPTLEPNDALLAARQAAVARGAQVRLLPLMAGHGGGAAVATAR